MMYNSILEKTVRGNCIDAKQFDDNVPHLSRCTAPLGRCNIVGAPFFRYGEDRYRSLSLRGLSHNSIPWNSHSFRAKLSAHRNRVVFSSMCFIMRNRSAVDEGGR